mgnify:CR=1 FL=1
MLYRKGPTSWAQTHNAEPIPYPYMKATTTYIMLLQWLLVYPWASQQVSHFRIPEEPD